MRCQLASGEESERRSALSKLSTKTFWNSVPKEEIFVDAMNVFPSSSHAFGLLKHKNKVVDLIPVVVWRAKARASDDHSSAVDGWSEMSASEKLSQFMRPGL